jgi:exopolyphosphatase/pppGpp-phosphohydrolase
VDTLNKLIEELEKQTTQAMKDLDEAIGYIKPAQHALAQILGQMKGYADELSAAESELRNKADYKTATKERQDQIAAAFKIGGAVIKALPLPEPFRVAAGAVGTGLDVTSAFIEDGSSDAAFTYLKAQVDTFAGWRGAGRV